MSKVTSMVGVMCGILIFAYFFGILPSNTASGALLTILLNPQSLENTNWVNNILLSIITVTGLIGTVYYSRFTPSDFYMMVPMVTLFLTFGWDFLQIYEVLASGGGGFKVAAIAILSPFMILYVIGVIEWWRGAV